MCKFVAIVFYTIFYLTCGKVCGYVENLYVIIELPKVIRLKANFTSTSRHYLLRLIK